ncbi:MAG: glycosyltransferase [Phycisphaerae bacterium]|nr:glycosyltransferase [Phycisphaerae bacterium]
MFKIQNIVTDNQMLQNCSRLFYTQEHRLGRSMLSFQTYFNTLWLQAWKEYTCASRFYLNIRFRGQCSIRLIQSHLAEVKYDSASSSPLGEIASERLFFQQTFYSDGSDYQQIEITGSDAGARMVYFEIDHASDFEYIDAFYSVDSAFPPARVKTAIVICTFRREQFVRRNLEILTAYFRKEPDLREVYDVFVVDNGRTLSADLAQYPVFLWPNKNTGGTGGFTRGIIEALRSDRNYTHVLLMDDDIEIFPEALQRTYALAALLKPDWHRSFIAGSMLRADMQHFQWEARSHIKGLQLEAYGRLFLSDFSSVVKNEILASRHTPRDYAAWWYCCIPLAAIQPDRLPLPFFVRGDDIDYSLACADKIIHLNGICVWHEPFESRRNNVVDMYMTVRNFTALSILHKSPLPLTVYHLMALFAGNIFTYNYKGAFLVCCGLRDAVRRICSFEDNQTELLDRYAAYNEIETNCAGDPSEAFKKIKLHVPVKLLIVLTYGGHLLPGFFFRKKTFALAGYRVAIAKCFASRHVCIYNPFTGKWTERKIDRLAAFALGFRFLFLLLYVVLFYPGIRRKLLQKEAQYRTLEFWKRYLEL